jgi:hypothetical protein
VHKPSKRERKKQNNSCYWSLPATESQYRIHIMTMNEQHHHQRQELDSDDGDSSARGKRNDSSSSRNKPSSLDFIGAAFRQNSSRSSSSSCCSSTPKTEQPLFSSLRDVAIQPQVDIDENADTMQALRQMMQSWILGILLPMSVVAWHVSGHRWSATAIAAFFMPTGQLEF